MRLQASSLYASPLDGLLASDPCPRLRVVPCDLFELIAPFQEPFFHPPQPPGVARNIFTGEKEGVLARNSVNLQSLTRGPIMTRAAAQHAPHTAVTEEAKGVSPT